MSKKKTFEEFLKQVQEKYHNTCYIYDKETYIDTHTKMRIICPKHGEFWQTPKSHLLYECEKCSYEKRGLKNRKSSEEFIEKAKTVHGNKYDYSKVLYKTAKTPITIICSKHGEFIQKPNDHLNGKGCPKCNESHLEREVERFLKENDFNFETQKKFDWLGKQSLDFYLPEYNTAIECQGKQHFGSGGWSENFDFKRLFELDERKYALCKENGLKLIYISNKRIKSYIKENIIYYKDIIFDIKELLKIKG